jgi:hypothetical protein
MIMWKEINGGKVNECGQVFGKKKILKPLIIDGYHYVCLNINGKWKHQAVHRLVAQAFIPNPLNKLQVNHKDGVKSNNVVNNLEWSTSLENNQHARQYGLTKQNGENCTSSHLKENEIIEIRKMKGIVTQQILAIKYGVSRPHISLIQNNKTWTHI